MTRRLETVRSDAMHQASLFGSRAEVSKKLTAILYRAVASQAKKCFALVSTEPGCMPKTQVRQGDRLAQVELISDFVTDAVLLKQTGCLAASGRDADGAAACAKAATETNELRRGTDGVCASQPSCGTAPGRPVREVTQLQASHLRSRVATARVRHTTRCAMFPWWLQRCLPKQQP